MSTSKNKIGVLGAGAWGTALAQHLAGKYSDIHLWAYESECSALINEYHLNPMYLPNLRLNDSIIATSNLTSFAQDLSHLIIVSPSHTMRAVLLKIRDILPKTCKIICASKGIENDTLMCMNEVIEETLGSWVSSQISILSGPSFALNVAQNKASSVSIAAKNVDFAKEMQQFISHRHFRAYWTDDIIGVQIGGSLKNVIAIAAGAAEGMGLGSNAIAALLTRGLAEMTRLGVKMGANPATLAGLSGLGDLALTCYGQLSRNRSLGFAIGQGISLEEATKNQLTIAEGVKTAKSAYALAQKHNVDMPITSLVYDCLYNNKSSLLALEELMSRELKHDGF